MTCEIASGRDVFALVIAIFVVARSSSLLLRLVRMTVELAHPYSGRRPSGWVVLMQEQGVRLGLPLVRRLVVF